MAFVERLLATESVHAPRGGVIHLEELLGISVLPLQSEDSTPGATGHLFPRPADSSLRTFTDKHRRQSTGSFWMCPGIRQRLLGLEPTCLLCMHGAGVDSVLTRVSPAWLHIRNTWHCVTDLDAQTPHQAYQTRISVELGKGIVFFNLSR